MPSDKKLSDKKIRETDLFGWCFGRSGANFRAVLIGYRAFDFGSGLNILAAFGVDRLTGRQVHFEHQVVRWPKRCSSTE